MDAPRPKLPLFDSGDPTFASRADAPRPTSDHEPNRNLVAADFEQYLRDNDGPIRCCPAWPECSHMLEWMQKRGDVSRDLAE